MFYTLIFIFK